MSQINVNPDDTRPVREVREVREPRDDGSRAAATNNLTWAVAMVLVIAAIAIAVVYVAQNLVH